MNPQDVSGPRQQRGDRGPADLLAQLLGDDEADVHLTYEQLEGLVDGCLSSTEHIRAERHVSDCPSCRDDAAHLTALAAQIRPRSSHEPVNSERRGPSIWRTTLPYLAAAAAIILAVVVLRSRDSGVRLVERQGTLTVLPDGRFRGLEGLAPEALSEVSQAWLAGHVEIPALPGSGRTPGVLLGGSVAPREQPAAPLGFVASDRPLFEWRGEGSATDYQVHVFDATGVEIARSSSLRERHWRPDVALPREQLLTWQLVFREDGVERVSPAPPAAEARFQIVAAATAAQLEAARIASGGSHLVMGVLFARAGLVGEARGEFQALVAANPEADRVKRLLGSLSGVP